MPQDNPAPKPRRPGWLPTALAAASALLVAALAVGTNKATELLPDWAWTQIAWLWWGLVGVLTLAVAGLAAWQVRAGPLPGSPEGSTAGATTGATANQQVGAVGVGHDLNVGRDLISSSGPQVGAMLGGMVIGHAEQVTLAPPAQAPPPTPGPEPEAEAPSPARTVTNLPPRNPHFTDGAGLLAALEERLSGRRVVTLHGLGGVGKTQLAVEHAYQHPGGYSLAWSVTADTPAPTVSGVGALAPHLGLDVEADLEATAAKVVRELGRREGWLLIFDNAEDPGLIRRLLPAGEGGRVLVTSRNPGFGQLGARLPVETWPTEQAARFLLARTGEHPGDQHQQAARVLAGELGGLPLALAQAAAYCEQTSLDLAGYLDRYRTRRGELLARGELVDYPATVATTWRLNLDQLTASQPAARELLRLCAFLAPDAIPLELLTAAPDLLPAPLAAVVGDTLALDEAIGGLVRFSLVQRDRRGLGVHRLVQAVVRDNLTVAQTRQWAACAVGLVDAAWPERPDDPRNWPQAGRLVTHAQTAAGHAQEYGAAPEATAGLLERALAINEAAYGPDHPQVAITLTSLGNVLFQAGELPAARQRLERALAINEAIYGPDHPQVAITLTNLGNVLREVGELPAARQRLERALAVFETAYGPDHAHTQTAERLLGELADDQA